MVFFGDKCSCKIEWVVLVIKTKDLTPRSKKNLTGYPEVESVNLCTETSSDHSAMVGVHYNILCKY